MCGACRSRDTRCGDGERDLLMEEAEALAAAEGAGSCRAICRYSSASSEPASLRTAASEKPSRCTSSSGSGL